MRFALPQMVNWLWAVVPVVLFLFWAHRRRKSVVQRFAQADLLGELMPGFAARRMVVKSALLGAAVFLSLVALARPQWGFEWQEVKRQGLDILLLVDVSKSMLTQDVNPNRLERTKLAIKDLLKKLDGDRIGIVAFAGEAFLTCPLTVDYSGFLLSLADLDTGTVPRGGTNIEAAINEAMQEYDAIPSKYKAVIIITDGDNLEGDPLAAAKKATQQGIKIYTVGIGTPQGELVRYKDVLGNFEFMKDEHGNFVKSRLNEKLLQDLALLTRGLYVRASGAEFGLDFIYDHALSKLERRDLETKKEKRYYERFQIPLAIALFLLVVETCLSVRRAAKMV